jgi:dienelactone hydrolase
MTTTGIVDEAVDTLTSRRWRSRAYPLWRHAVYSLAALLLLFLGVTEAAEVGRVGTELGPLGRETWLLPSQVPGLLMHAVLFRPKAEGPFPLAVINHGSEQDARVRKKMQAPSFPKLTVWLLERGYAVLLPQRPGHGATGGEYFESQGWCGAADFEAAGDGAARSIIAAIQYMQRQEFIDRLHVVVIGNSAGGWGTLALAAQNPPGVVAAVNFAGGLGGRNRNKPNSNCSPERLVQASSTYGGRARVPTLWLYSENDTFFGPKLSLEMAAAFSAAGGEVDYELLPAVEGDGHALIDSEPTWSRVLARFLGSVAR